MSPLIRLSVTYALFAALAAAVNLSSQWVVLRLWALVAVRSLPAVLLALVVGTGAGFVLKYTLDKRYIFNDTLSGVRTHAVKFSLYSVMGVATTIIFWGAEGARNWYRRGSIRAAR